jgi:hypothetical protein
MRRDRQTPASDRLRNEGLGLIQKQMPLPVESPAKGVRRVGSARHTIRRFSSSLAGLFVFDMQALAAGAHHAVDDATMLEPGQCQMESWVDRESGAARTLVHLGPACRVGAVELGLNLDRSRSTGERTSVVAGPQVKWVRPLSDAWSAGVVMSAGWQDMSPRFVGSTIVFPLTWQPSRAW